MGVRSQKQRYYFLQQLTGNSRKILQVCGCFVR